MAESITTKILWTWLLLHTSWVSSTINLNPLNIAPSPVTALYRDTREGYRPDRTAYRCLSCMYGNGQENNRDRQDVPPRGGAYEDRNWYYQPDRNEDRSRYGDRNSASYDTRYDDRYSSNRYDNRPNGYSDRNDPRYSYSDNRGYDYRGVNDYRGANDYRGVNDYRGYDNRGNDYRGYDNRGGDYRGYGYRGADNRENDYRGADYRGNGYDNRDPNYDSVRGLQSSRDRYPDRGGSDVRYGSRERDTYDGYNSRPAYDYRNYRPYDETYRGTSGFDSSGRGYYFANKPAQSPQSPHSQPPPSQNPTLQNNHQTYENSSSSGTGNKGYAGAWGYANDRDNVQNYHKDKDTQSSAYGSRTRPIGPSYHYERDAPGTKVEGRTIDDSDNQQNDDRKHDPNQQ